MSITRRGFLKGLGGSAALAPLLMSSRAQSAPGERQPNLVLVFIDDMGYGDVGPFGSVKNRTPHLDRMATEGMRLTSFYAAPVCSVSRAQVITGCYGPRVSIPGVFFPGSPTGLSAEEHTIAELLKAQGYATMCIGKWHLGDQPEFLPTRHGFDHYLGLPYSNDMQRKAKADGRNVVPLVRDEQVIELLEGEGQDQLTERYTDEAVKFITEHRDGPFFLYLPHTAVHVPIHPGGQFQGKSQNGRYGDWVEEVDWSVGRVLQTIRDLGLSENTLVVFTSDNGPWLTKGNDGGSAGPLRGGKGSTWEGGVREPTIAWWPGRIAAGAACDAVAGNIDILPTFVGLAGGTVPTDRVTDGRDFSPLLFGQSSESQREAHYYYHGYKLEAVRVGPWKLAIAPQPGSDTDGQVTTLDSPRLYNLDAEIGEITNVAADHPEQVERLKALAAAMIADLGNGQPGPGVRQAGRVENPETLYASEPTKVAGAGTTAAIVDRPIGTTLEGAKAPLVQNRTVTIACQVQTSAKDGVIVAHGGSAVGYTLYLKDGHLVFAVHQSNQDIVQLTAPEAFSGKGMVEASIGKGGALELKVDGRQVAKGKVAGLLSRQPAEAFCVGHDDKVTVDSYDGAKRFEGTITSLKVSTEAVK